ncbi:MAG TPA: Mrp/NBP35 family ATP-binding protein [Pirellulaceae bacterium]|nr:Mrp/NBP35 family ATP-binding protein [Pirellulaceae bacterium]
MAAGQTDPATFIAALRDFKDPETGRGILDFDQLRCDQLTAESVDLTLRLTTHSAPIWNETRDALRERVQVKFPHLKQINITLAVLDRPAQPIGQIGLKAKSIIAVGSGKGGVGKSTLAVSIALGLKRAGCSVGLMDADVYGPSVPHLLGVGDQQPPPNLPIEPVKFEGMPVMSIGFFVPANQAIIWRGPKLHGAVTQFLRDTNWGTLDYLIIDMPPGTGDVALTLSQLLPLTGCVIVCTPQEVALLDAVKAISMFRTVNIPVLGMVENMSGFLCPDNNQRYDIFGKGGARQKAEELGLPFLGDVPITMSIREHGDAGETNSNFNDPQVAPYLEKICATLVRNLSQQAAISPPMPSLPVL